MAISDDKINNFFSKHKVGPLSSLKRGYVENHEEKRNEEDTLADNENTPNNRSAIKIIPNVDDLETSKAK